MIGEFSPVESNMEYLEAARSVLPDDRDRTLFAWRLIAALMLRIDEEEFRECISQAFDPCQGVRAQA